MYEQPTEEKALSISDTNVSGLFGCLMYLFGFCFSTAFFGIGSLFLWFSIISPLLEINSAKSWVETPCVISHSEVKGKQNLRAIISYTYEFQNREFESEQFSLINFNSSKRIDLERLIAQYPKGSKHVCYVNPQFPSEAVLDREPKAVMWLGLISIPFILVGLVGYYVLWNISRWKKKLLDHTNNVIDEQRGLSSAKSTLPSTLTAMSDSDYDDDDLTETPGPVTLEAEGHGLILFIFLSIFGLFWTGFVGTTFVHAVMDVIRNGWNSSEIFLALFMIPFVLVGLGLLSGAVYCGLAFFNPIPTMVLSRQLIPLGGSANVSWSFKGSTRSIRNLKISIKGTEEATYRRGTDTTTDTETFYEVAVFESLEQIDIAEGAVDFTIPTDTMHTFNGGNNKIKWTINIHGDIPLWPDVNAPFPIRVVPHE